MTDKKGQNKHFDTLPPAHPFFEVTKNKISEE